MQNRSSIVVCEHHRPLRGERTGSSGRPNIIRTNSSAPPSRLRGNGDVNGTIELYPVLEHQEESAVIRSSACSGPTPRKQVKEFRIPNKLNAERMINGKLLQKRPKTSLFENETRRTYTNCEHTNPRATHGPFNIYFNGRGKATPATNAMIYREQLRTGTWKSKPGYIGPPSASRGLHADKKNFYRAGIEYSPLLEQSGHYDGASAGETDTETDTECNDGDPAACKIDLTINDELLSPRFLDENEIGVNSSSTRDSSTAHMSQLHCTPDSPSSQVDQYLESKPILDYFSGMIATFRDGSLQARYKANALKSKFASFNEAAKLSPAALSEKINSIDFTKSPPPETNATQKSLLQKPNFMAPTPRTLQKLYVEFENFNNKRDDLGEGTNESKFWLKQDFSTRLLQDQLNNELRMIQRFSSSGQTIMINQVTRFVERQGGRDTTDDEPQSSTIQLPPKASEEGSSNCPPSYKFEDLISGKKWAPERQTKSSVFHQIKDARLRYNLEEAYTIAENLWRGAEIGQLQMVSNKVHLSRNSGCVSR
ncbi:AaceriAFR072Wp [[Ashbya] aceris (nom. inval.)]|nr:AaceriAFR072Wp [[Ashbya] aceris (nom. inval.)]